MSDNKNLKDNKQIKSYFKQDKQRKNTKQEKSMKIINIENEKEKEEKPETNSCKRENNEQSKTLLDNNIFKRKKFLVNKEIKLQKADEKKSGSETHLNQLKKKKNNICNYFKQKFREK